MALANRLVGNNLEETSLEITYGGFEATTEQACAVAIAGAADQVLVSGKSAPTHETLHLNAGDQVSIAPFARGARAYLSVRSGFSARAQFGATSTYLPGRFGGHEGRALRAGDRVEVKGPAAGIMERQTPLDLRPAFEGKFALRATTSAETKLLSNAARDLLFNTTFSAGRQGTRMGITLEGQTIVPDSDGKMESVPVFPGTIQSPPSGRPVILLCDAQTTGGYPRIASIARCDQHLLGQVRPGDAVRLLFRAHDQALSDDLDKRALLDAWLIG